MKGRGDNGHPDVLIANFTPGVLVRLGIGYGDLSACNPRIIVAEMPAFGPGGPDSHHQGMGKTMEAACGMTSLMGYGEGAPVLTGPSLSYQLDCTPGGISSAAPCFGVHNELILQDSIGLSDTQVRTLVATGAVTDRPSAAT